MNLADTTSLDPEALIASFEARAHRVETPCGDGTMVWRIWQPEHPTKNPVVLGHGAQGAWSHWIANIDVLARERMVIVPDLPSHGESAAPDVEDHAHFAAVLAEGLRQIVPHALPVDFVGFSFGGVVFAHLAALQPGIVRSLTLIGCGGFDTPHGDVRLGRVGGLQGDERRAALKSNLLGLMLHASESVDDFAIYQLEHNGRRSRIKTAMEMVIPDRLVQVLPQITVPVHAIWGERDRPHPDPALHERILRRTHPEAEFRVIPEAGHWAMYERPAAFNAALLDILD